MNELKIFESPEFGIIRTVEVDGEPWLVGKDVARALGYSNTKDALAKHVDPEDKWQDDGVAICDSMGRKQHPVIINESGLYSLVLSSKLPTAKKFKHWVTSEVLPSIRKNGGYIADQEQLSDAELMAKALIVAQKTIEARDSRICELSAENTALIAKQEADRPLVEFATKVIKSDGSVSVSDFAKMLCSKGMKLGNRRLLWWLRDNKYLMKNFMPYQRWVNSGIFEVVDITYKYSVFPRAYITPKGQKYLYEKLKEAA